ncbi:MAG: endo,4-beta-xylanase precursor [Flavipsychrobacter sp.]|jgi:gliding motility-associated-like protein|nr:endo,4-beta-xylanase precursor [Flavipsychrobacter sp.]
MKKLYSRSLIAFLSPQRDRIKALRIFLLALALSCFGYSGYAQVVVTPANDTAICAQTALSTTTGACTLLGTITISETLNSDFSAGADRIILNPPTGWQFCTTPAPTITVAGGGDITPSGVILPTSFNASSLQIDFNPGGVILHDQITITGLRIQPVLTGSASGIIHAFSTTGIAGIVTGPTGTSFGKLGLIPVPISGTSPICVNDCHTFTSSPGVTWSTSNAAVASVSAGGVVCGVSAGPATITATLGSCYQVMPVNVNPLPAPIVITDSSLCAWYDSISVSDPTLPGTFTSTLVTADNSVGSGMAKIKAGPPGIGVIRYTHGVTGCYVERRVTVNPNPYPILPADMTPPFFEICRGSTRIYTSVPGGGTWATASTAIATVATIGTGDGAVTGVAVGTTKLIYTAPGTGCRTDTTIQVNDLPTPIAGDVEICAGETTTLSSGPCGGSWSLVPGAPVATITGFRGCGDSVDITGTSAGTTIVLYTLSTGCAQITTLTVNPLPGAITGPTSVCEGSTITLLTSSTGGVWRSGDITVATIDSLSGDLTGIDSGTVLITYILPTGCYATAVITVNPLPTAIVGPDSMCVGDPSVLYTSSPSLGSWTSSNISIGVIDTTGMFTPLSPGITNICYTLSTTCQVCKIVTVNPVPLPISGTTSLCFGGTGALSDPTLGGTWFSTDTFRVTVDTSGNIVGVGITPAGGTEIRYYVGACYASVFVTVHPVPVISGTDIAVCQNDTLMLTGTPPGGIWTSQDTTTATVDSFSGVVTGVGVGTVLISYTTTGGCIGTYTLNVHPIMPIFGPNTVCKYDSIVINDSTIGGAWTHTPGTFAAVINLGGSIVYQAKVIGLSAGVETITYTAPGPLGCFSTFSVTVNPIEPIIGPSALCVGVIDTLTNVVPGGIWTVTPHGAVSVTTTSSGGVVTALSPGIDTVTYTIVGSGCFATHIITVNPVPGFIEGDSTVCVGLTTTYTSADTGGRWTSSAPGIASIDSVSGVITGVFPGVAIITYSFATGCFVTEDIIVLPRAPITITPDDQLCVGDTAYVFDTTTGGTWSITNTTIASIDAGGMVIGLVPGVDTIVYTTPAGCVSILPITVNPNPSPIVGPDSVCQFDTITLSNPDSGGTWTSRFGFTVVGLLDGSVLGSVVGIDSIYYTFPTGCRTVKHVVVNRTPTPIIGPTQVCVGRTTVASLFSTPASGYWTVNDPTIVTLIPGVAGSTGFHGDSVDTTSIIYTLPVGSCRVRVVVTVQPIPVIVVNPPTIKCKYEAVTLVATGAVTPGSTAGTYTWSPAYGLNTTLGHTVVATPTITTVYTVRGTNPATGCDSFTTVTVLVDDALNNMKVVGDSNICNGECTILMASGRANTFYNWHPSVGLSCTICDTVRACPDTSTTYWAVAIDDIGCKDSVRFRVYVHPVPVVLVDPNPAIVCRGTPTQLTASSPNTDDTTNMYTWKPNLFISCDTCYNPVINDTANIVYRVRATTIWGCHDSLDVKVSVLDTNLNTISNDTNICIGSPALLVATSKSLVSNLDLPTFTWLSNDNSVDDPDSSVTLVYPTTTQTYTLAIRENQCFSDTLTVTVFVEPYPDIDIVASSTTNIVAGTPVRLIANVRNNAPVQFYAWAPANTLSCDSCFNPEAIPVVNTTYTVTVGSIYGCVASDTISLNLFCDKEQIYMPNTFTPNGDGANDIFYVRGKGIRMVTLFQVYNRWGQMVFEQRNIQANDVTRGWDGTFKGLVLQPDVFTYVVKAFCDLSTDNVPFTYTGDVSIVK